MGIGQQITRAFIWFGGITRPRPGKEDFARNYILGIIGGTLVILCAMFFLLQGAINR